jgi:hypothetical protein
MEKSMLKHIYTDENRINRFDKYFSYIDSIKAHLPESLYLFASDVSRYELSNRKSLHDAWIEEITIQNQYVENSIESKIYLKLVLASGAGVSICYAGVQGHEIHGIPSMWPDKATDLLTHEVSLEPNGLYSHALVFDRDVYFKVFFRFFSIEDCPSSSGLRRRKSYFDYEGL